MHTSPLSKALISEVSAEAVFFFLPVSSDLMITLVVVVTVHHAQGYIKHKARWAGTRQCERLVFPSGPHRCEVSDVPFSVSHP